MAREKYLNYSGLEHLSEYIKERLVIVNSIPASPNDGDVVLYMGETTASYTHGYLYSYSSADADWKIEATGIKLKLNGEIISGETEIYAPIQSGSRGDILVSNGENQAPTWSPITEYRPQVAGDALLFR